MHRKRLPRLLAAALSLAPLILSAALSFAQAPPAVPALPDQERRTSYSISASTCACSVNFALFGSGTDVDAWIEVWISGTRYLSTDPTFGWSLSSATGPLATIPRPVTDAVLTFNAVQTGTVQIVGAERPRRTAQFAENRGVAARDLNQAVTDLYAVERELWDKTNDVTGRAILGLPGEVIKPMPPAALRAGRFLSFDSTGLIPQFASVAGTGGPLAAAALCFNGGAFPIYNPVDATWECSTGGGAGSFAVLNTSPLQSTGAAFTINANGGVLPPIQLAAGPPFIVPTLWLTGPTNNPTSGETNIWLDAFTTNGNGSINCSKANGGLGALTATINQNIMCIWSATGWWNNSGTLQRTTLTEAIQFRSEGNFSGTSWPTSIGFFVDPLNATNPVELMRIGAGGVPGVTFPTPGIGTTQTDAIILSNTTQAAAGAQQISPSLHWIGQGWKTNATAASQQVEWIATNLPQQGTSAPTGNLDFSSQINGGGYIRAARFTSGGVIDAPAGYTAGGVSVAAGQVIRSNGTQGVFAQLGCADLSTAQSGCSVIPARIQVIARGVNFNSANTDTTIAVAIPAGVTNYQVNQVRIANASASISTATWGLFSAAAGGGTAIFAAGQTVTVTTAAANTNNNSMTAAPANQNTQSFNFANLFFRVGTAQGSAATADVIVDLVPL